MAEDSSMENFKDHSWRRQISGDETLEDTRGKKNPWEALIE